MISGWIFYLLLYYCWLLFLMLANILYSMDYSNLKVEKSRPVTADVSFIKKVLTQKVISLLKYKDFCYMFSDSVAAGGIKSSTIWSGAEYSTNYCTVAGYHSICLLTFFIRLIKQILKRKNQERFTEFQTNHGTKTGTWSRKNLVCNKLERSSVAWFETGL